MAVLSLVWFDGHVQPRVVQWPPCNLMALWGALSFPRHEQKSPVTEVQMPVEHSHYLTNRIDPSMEPANRKRRLS